LLTGQAGRGKGGGRGGDVAFQKAVEKEQRGILTKGKKKKKRKEEEKREEGEGKEGGGSNLRRPIGQTVGNCKLPKETRKR